VPVGLLWLAWLKGVSLLNKNGLLPAAVWLLMPFVRS
jgi:hypothetical protein